MQDNNENTLVLDMRKVTSQHFRPQYNNLCPRLHINSKDEDLQLEKDLSRSKIIVDNNGTRTTCSSIAEFRAATTMLSSRQRQYILNVGHQGLFGGGSALIPAQINSPDIFFQDIRNHTNSEGEMYQTADVPLCVSIQDGKVALTNTIDFPIMKYNAQGHAEPFLQDTSLTLSMVADITNLSDVNKTTSAIQIKEMPIYMTISHQNKPADLEILNDFRKLENNAEVTGPTKTNITNFIQQVRDDKTYDNIMHGQNASSVIDIIEELAIKSLDNSKTLEERQQNLDNILDQSTFKIPEGTPTTYEIASKILSSRTSPDKDQIRLHYAAHAITKYATSFDNQRGKPSSTVVAKIVDTLIEDTKTKNILQKNAGLILRHATENKDLSFKDRVKKVLDRISIAIMPKVLIPEKHMAKNFAEQIRSERQKTQRSFGR